MHKQTKIFSNVFCQCLITIIIDSHLNLDKVLVSHIFVQSVCRFRHIGYWPWARLPRKNVLTTKGSNIINYSHKLISKIVFRNVQFNAPFPSLISKPCNPLSIFLSLSMIFINQRSISVQHRKCTQGFYPFSY